jgi:hypothetical protein
MSNPEKYNNIIQYGDFLPSNFKQNLDFFEQLFKQTPIKDKVIRTTYNTTTPIRNTYNPLYYNIVEYLLSELYLTENTNTQYNLNNILTKIKNIKSLSDIDEIIDNDLYNLCITTRSQKCINIVQSQDLDIYYKKRINNVNIIFVIKNTNNTINIQIPHNKEYNPNMVGKDHIVYIMDYKQLNDKENFLYNCINNTFSINDVSNEHLTILKNTLGFHYSRNCNCNRHMFFPNIENILDIYLACDNNNNIELLYSIIKSTPYDKNKDSINNLELLETIQKITNRYLYIFHNIQDIRLPTPGIIDKNELQIFHKVATS